ncbi:hypothetical protein QAD02_022799 [Eretmocerus hayati]|uniref:Uncharacterized protein n=1 Tax=Eretmocerus hayati TaxID=131215 RepID=A0ACC2PUB1_9HYME|nr:hypothetical protein QAD02_022799 [Eretmocerus hayati]
MALWILLLYMRGWARNNSSVPQSTLDSLLKVLHRHHLTLPRSSRTLLKRPTNHKYNIERLNSVTKGVEAEFVYLGITAHLQKTVNPEFHEESVLPLGFNVDGLSLYRSSSIEFWVTSGKVYTKKDYYKPFPLSVHCGAGKPAHLNHYFDKFITEINDLLANGIVIEQREFTIEIFCFCCDRPARCFIKCTKGHGGYWACEVCMIKGELVNKTVYYPVISTDSIPIRTDASFRSRENPEHHHEVSPLVKLDDTDMINDFLMEFMHQGCLGNTKKISTDHWFKLKKNFLTREQMLTVSQRLINIANQIPSDFQRTTRTLAECSLWKATEWRFFLLYAAALIMKDILPDHVYRHFMLLSTGCLILDSESLYDVYTDEADEFLRLFCELAPGIYGPEISTINLHNTSHLARDVKNKKLPLSAFSAFCYENLYGEMERFIRSGYRPLQQPCNRIDDCFSDKKPQIEPDFQVLKMKRRQDGSTVISKIKCKSCELSNTKPNNLVLLKSGEIMRVKSMQSSKKPQRMDQVVLKGSKIRIVGLAYEYPCDSSLFNIFQVIEEENSEKIEEELINVDCKMFMLSIYEFPEDGNAVSYALPLLHSK